MARLVGERRRVIYHDSIKLLHLLFVSGAHWLKVCVELPTAGAAPDRCSPALAIN